MPEDISFVLALDKRMVQCVLDDLCGMGILETGHRGFQFRETGREMYQRGVRLCSLAGEELFLFNTVSGTVEPGELNKPGQMRNKGGIFLEKKDGPGINSPDVRSRLLSYIKDKYENTRQVQSFKVSSLPSERFRKYDLMLYQNREGELKLLLYDLSSKLFDYKVSEYLQDCYSSDNLKELSGIRKLLEKDREEEDNYGRQAPIQYMMNREIREITKGIFDMAKSSVLIVSPWLGTEEFVLTDRFLEQMEAALSRGVRVTIFYGYLSKEKLEKLMNRGGADDDKNVQTEKSAERMRRRFSNYPGFKLSYRNTHEKILCCDERFCIIGSFNYLSYDGGEKNDYQGYNFRREGAVYIEEPEFVRNLMKKLS